MRLRDLAIIGAAFLALMFFYDFFLAGGELTDAINGIRPVAKPGTSTAL